MKPVLVTTKHRGVFGGLVPDDQDMTARTIAIKEARCAIKFGTTRGIAQLAETGPTGQSRIGAPADLEAIHDVTAVWTITEAAWEKWCKSSPATT